MTNQTEPKSAPQNPFKVRESTSTHGDRLLWRCSSCTRASHWANTGCTHCGAALLEEPVIQVEAKRLGPYLRMVAAIGEALPLFGLHCPACDEDGLEVRGVRDSSHMALRVDCQRCHSRFSCAPDSVPIPL